MTVAGYRWPKYDVTYIVRLADVDRELFELTEHVKRFKAYDITVVRTSSYSVWRSRFI